MSWKDLIFILVILLCPLMHILMMRGHNSNKDKKTDNDSENKSCH